MVLMRGTKVKVNDKGRPAHLIGSEGIVLSRMKNHPEWIRVLQEADIGWCDIGYKEDQLDIIEEPIEV